MNLLPCPRVLERLAGWYQLPRRALLSFDPKETGAQPVVERLRHAAREVGVRLTAGQSIDSRDRMRTGRVGVPGSIRFLRAGKSLPAHAESYAIGIHSDGITVEYHEPGGLRAAVATLRQLLREFDRRLPCLNIRDWPDFSRRAVMLDISRGRVPKLETLLDLVDRLADFKINEFQLYIEHTFAYRKYRPVWRGWGALTAGEVRRLDRRCGELGIDLVPNQNSFGHLRRWLEYPPLKGLAEVSGPYRSSDGDCLRYPSTLAPNHPDTLRFLRELYDELLPNFTSRFFNVGCDETWDLGRGQSRVLCERKGKGRVYLDFLKKIRRELRARGRRMMFWGDIILRYPELVRKLPGDVVALNWGYEAGHPFDREAALFARSGAQFYVCPGTSTWMTLIGRHDNALANLRSAARAGRRHGAAGYLVADWGDGGHPQPLAVSFVPYLAGASLSWCVESFDGGLLVPVLSRDICCDRSRQLAGAAMARGLAHRRFGFGEVNSTPFGTTLAAPPAEWREVFCRNGLKNYSRIPGNKVRAALAEVERQLVRVRRSRPGSRLGRIFRSELDLAARMAAESCHFMLWQQALAGGKRSLAQRLARRGAGRLRKLDREFNAFWPVRNKGTPEKCSTFLHWRLSDYERSATG